MRIVSREVYKKIFSEFQNILPISVKNEDFIIEKLEKIFLDYISTIKRYQNSKLIEESTIQKVIDACATILQFYSNVYQGKTFELYNLHSTNLFKLISILPVRKFNKNSTFFRIRISEEFNTLSRKDLFHIPFEKRNKVTTKRFSIPGSPSLYLGTSSYICWEELGRPSFNNIQICSLRNTKRLNLLDLSYSNFLNYDDQSTQKELQKKFIVFPVILASSLIPNIKNSDPFKIEYSFPQFISYFVNQKSDKLDGIIYTSTKTSPKLIESTELYDNIVISPKFIRPIGYCQKLTSIFKMSEVVAGWHTEFINFQNEELIDTKSDLIIDGVKVNYNNTRFSLLEQILAKKETLSIKPDFEGE